MHSSPKYPFYNLNVCVVFCLYYIEPFGQRINTVSWFIPCPRWWISTYHHMTLYTENMLTPWHPSFKCENVINLPLPLMWPTRSLPSPRLQNSPINSMHVTSFASPSQRNESAWRCRCTVHTRRMYSTSATWRVIIDCKYSFTMRAQKCQELQE